MVAVFVHISNTHRSAQHAMEFKQLPSMKVKGKEHPIDVFMPTGVLISKVQTGPELVCRFHPPGWHCWCLPLYENQPEEE